MEEYEVTATVKVKITAFSEDDAQEAVIEDLNDLPGATVTDLLLVDTRKID